jgi:hypothetical protein
MQSKQYSWFLKDGVLYLSLTLLFLLQLHNLSFYPPQKGFDAAGHIEYIQKIKSESRFPLAEEGVQMYHPPLYYSLGSLFPNISTLQASQIFLYLGLLLICGYLIRKLFKDTFLVLLAATFVGTQAVILYLTYQISNELLSTVLISITLVFYMLESKPLALIKTVFLGCVASLALLTKATGLVVILTLFILMLFRDHQSLKKRVLYCSVFLGVVLILGGWFFLRNYFVYGNPFITNMDFRQFYYTQPPGFRDLAFFFNVSSIFSFDLYKAHWYSFLGGTLFSWFYDGHNVLIPVQAFSRAGELLILASLPLLVVALRGMYQGIRTKDRYSLVLALYSGILLLLYLLYTIKVPFYSSVKSTYISSLTLPLCYFFIFGIRSLRVTKIVVSIYMFLYVMLVLKNLWILSHWY